MTVAAPPVTGKAARRFVPRSEHADWEPPAGRRDPISILEAEAADRVAELVPIRHARMASSAFAFYRGTAGIMASDLASTASTGVRVQLCGDAHISNFGGFASPERNLLFDLDDFDETIPGPWEWDIKRLAASIVIAGRERGLGRRRRREVTTNAVAAYRTAIRRFAAETALDVFYAQLDDRTLAAQLRTQLDAQALRQYDRGVAKARSKDSARAFSRLAQRVNGRARIVADPPLITPVEDLVSPADAANTAEFMEALLGRYRETLPIDRRRLLDRYRYAHAARKVVGVGSVGTRAWVLLLTGRDHGDPLFLQAKEAGPSVLAPFVDAPEHQHQGRRVVEGQRLMQAAGDPFLGWITAEGVDRVPRDFYVRQLWNWKASADVDRLTPEGLDVYGQLCGWVLARAHARTGDRAAIASYLGSGSPFDEALAQFGERYADQSEEDYGRFLSAIESGRLAASV